MTITPEEMREMADRLEQTPERPMRDIALGNGNTTRGPSFSTFSQDEQDRKAASAMLRSIAAEREAGDSLMKAARHARIMIDNFIHGEDGQDALESAHKQLSSAIAKGAE